MLGHAYSLLEVTIFIWAPEDPTSIIAQPIRDENNFKSMYLYTHNKGLNFQAYDWDKTYYPCNIQYYKSFHLYSPRPLSNFWIALKNIYVDIYHKIYWKYYLGPNQKVLIEITPIAPKTLINVIVWGAKL